MVTMIITMLTIIILFAGDVGDATMIVVTVSMVIMMIILIVIIIIFFFSSTFQVRR